VIAPARVKESARVREVVYIAHTCRRVKDGSALLRLATPAPFTRLCVCPRAPASRIPAVNWQLTARSRGS